MIVERLGDAVLIRGTAVAAAFQLLCAGIDSRAARGLPATTTELTIRATLAEAYSHRQRNFGHCDVVSSSSTTQSKTIDTNEVARILGIEPRTAQRLGPRYGQQQPNGRWRFDPQTVYRLADQRRART